MIGPQAPRSPVPQEISTELQRVVDRWHQLPLDHALSYAGRVRTLVQSLAEGVAEAGGVPASPVPDLGPATLMDQLTVLVYDASLAAANNATAMSASTGTPTLTSSLTQHLATLRRALR